MMSLSTWFSESWKRDWAKVSRLFHTLKWKVHSLCPISREAPRELYRVTGSWGGGTPARPSSPRPPSPPGQSRLSPDPQLEAYFHQFKDFNQSQSTPIRRGVKDYCSRCDGPGGPCTLANQLPVNIDGNPVGIDYCIYRIVLALNLARVKTKASCCGHGMMKGNIVLDDGRVLIIQDEPTSMDGWKNAIILVGESDVAAGGAGGTRDILAVPRANSGLPLRGKQCNVGKPWF